MKTINATNATITDINEIVRSPKAGTTNQGLLELNIVPGIANTIAANIVVADI